jgi:hypothetical protein
MKPVTDHNGVCRYLVKYLTKAHYPEWVLAVLYRKRLWGTTNRKPKEWEQGYVMVDIIKGQSVESVLDGTNMALDTQKTIQPLGGGLWEITGKVEGSWVRWLLRETHEMVIKARDIEDEQRTGRERRLRVAQEVYARLYGTWGVDKLPGMDGPGDTL